MPLSHPRLWKALDALARREGLTPSGLARRAGLDPTSFNPSKRHGPSSGRGDPPRPRWPSTESLARVLETTGISLGDFAALADEAPRPAVVPLLGLAQAGEAGFFDDAGLPAGEGWEETELPQPGETLLSLRIAGDSMTPVYRAGDRVIVDRAATEVRRGDRVVARTTDGETLVKEVAAINARAVTLASINPAYPPREIARRDILWMGRVLWVSQ